MKPATWIVALVLAWGAAQYEAYSGELWFEGGVGNDIGMRTGKNPMSVIRVRYEMLTKAWWTPDVVEWNHHSSITEGKPFNDRPEDTADQFSVIWRFKLW